MNVIDSKKHHRLLPKISTKMLAGVTILVGAAFPLSLSADDKLPSAESILDNHIEAIGGKKLCEKIENRVLKGVQEIPARNLEISVEIYQAQPDKAYYVFQSDLTGKVEQGSNGKTAWQVSEQVGMTVHKSERRAWELRRSLFDPIVHWRQNYQRVECTTEEDIEGKACYKVVLIPKPVTGLDGKPIELTPTMIYFDKKSKLILREDSVIPMETETLTIQTLFSDYKQIDGVLFAHTRKIIVGGRVRVTKFDSVKQNVQLPKNRFALPDCVKALIEDGKK